MLFQNDVHLITVPWSRLLEGPWRNVRVTVPAVVGVHFNVVGLPAVRLKSLGTLNGLGLSAAIAMATRVVSEARIEKRIFDEIL